MKGMSLFLLAALLTVSVLTASQAHAQSYTITWWTIDGGGGTSTGGSYTLSGTVGQPDAGVLSGGGYSLTGGFWGMDVQRYIFLPLIFKD